MEELERSWWVLKKKINLWSIPTGTLEQTYWNNYEEAGKEYMKLSQLE